MNVACMGVGGCVVGVNGFLSGFLKLTGSRLPLLVVLLSICSVSSTRAVSLRDKMV